MTESEYVGKLSVKEPEIISALVLDLNCVPETRSILLIPGYANDYALATL